MAQEPKNQHQQDPAVPPDLFDQYPLWAPVAQEPKNLHQQDPVVPPDLFDQYPLWAPVAQEPKNLHQQDPVVLPDLLVQSSQEHTLHMVQLLILVDLILQNFHNKFETQNHNQPLLLRTWIQLPRIYYPMNNHFEDFQFQ